MEYLLLIRKNTQSTPNESEWIEFIEKAIATGMFQGGSQLGSSLIIGKDCTPLCTDQIGGFMRFKAIDLDELKSLLTEHPVVKNGGSIELIDMPTTP